MYFLWECKNKIRIYNKKPSEEGFNGDRNIMNYIRENSMQNII